MVREATGETRGGRRVLFVSSSIGLGHIRRDLAIAAELRRRRPGLQVEWLVGPPAERVVRERGETLLAESARLPDENASLLRRARRHRLNILRSMVGQAVREWNRSFAVFAEVVRAHPYDLIVRDETWAVNANLARRPELRYCPHAYLFDFFPVDVSGFNLLDRALAWYANRSLIARPHADLEIFVGRLEDIPDRSMGLGLPNARALARTRFRCVGPVLEFDPELHAGRREWRRKLGYPDDVTLVVCSVGGLGVGAELLSRCGRIYPLLKQRLPRLRMVLVCGPRIDPASVSAPPGVEVRGYLPNLPEHHAAADAAVTSGGWATCLELTALGKPFVAVPREDDFEQRYQTNVVASYGATLRMRLSRTTDQELAAAVERAVASTPQYLSVPTDGAARAADLILGLLPH